MKNYIFKSCFFVNLLFLFAIIEISYGIELSSASDTVREVQKIRDLLIYKNPEFYSTFPSVIKKDDGEIIVAFRRAPDRKIFGEKGSTHIDPNSYLVTVSSKNKGETWTQEPELLYAHPF